MSAMREEGAPDPRNVRRNKKNVRISKKQKEITHITRHGRPKKKSGPKKSPEEIAAIHAKQLQALQLRMAGTTYGEIARALGYANPSSAKAAVDASIWRAEKDAAKEVVALDLARLDEYQMRCTHALRTNGDLHQIDRLMRIMEMRYRLLGISDETVRALQQDHGIVVNQKNMVMNIHAAPETEKDFIGKMMKAVGVDPESEVAKRLLSEHDAPLALPMLEGSANDGKNVNRTGNDENDEDDDIVEAEIVEEM